MNPNQFAAIMPYISADLVEMIAEKENISENAAITKLFNSELYAILEQEDTKVWHYLQYAYAVFAFGTGRKDGENRIPRCVRID